jgi:hypothetical protein
MNSTYGFNGVPLYVSVELNRDGLEWPSLAVAQSVALRRLLGDARKYNPGEVLHVFTRPVPNEGGEEGEGGAAERPSSRRPWVDAGDVVARCCLWPPHRPRQSLLKEP